MINLKCINVLIGSMFEVLTFSVFKGLQPIERIKNNQLVWRKKNCWKFQFELSLHPLRRKTALCTLQSPTFNSQIQILHNTSGHGNTTSVVLSLYKVIFWFTPTALFHVKFCVYSMTSIKWTLKVFNYHVITVCMRHALNTPNRMETVAINAI